LLEPGLEQREEVGRIGFFATVKSLTHVIQGLHDGLEVLGTVESGFSEVVEQALDEKRHKCQMVSGGKKSGGLGKGNISPISWGEYLDRSC
jgi:hypothetical protein